MVLSAAIEAFIISNPELNGLIAGLMLLPALASEVTRLVLRECFVDVSFRFGGQRSWSTIGLSLIFPVVIGLIAYGIAWTSGLAGFDPPTASRSLVAAFILVAVGMFVSLILVSGEEIG